MSLSGGFKRRIFYTTVASGVAMNVAQIYLITIDIFCISFLTKSIVKNTKREVHFCDD